MMNTSHSGKLAENNSGNATSVDKTIPAESLPEMSAIDYETVGDRYFANQDYAMAFMQYNKSLNLKPHNTRVLYKQGLLFQITEQYIEATKYFREVTKREPDNPSAHEGIGTAAFKMQDYEKAEPEFLKAIELSPRMWRSHNFLGNIYDFRKDYDQAAREYAEAILIRPNDAKLYNNIGVSLYLSGRYEESINAFKKALGAEGDKQKVYNNLGLVLAKTKRYEAAFEIFQKGSNKPEAYNNLGCVYMAQGNYQKAEQMFNKAIEACPKFYHTAHENLKKLEVARMVP
jgi:Flp pilus assembly protein TadD